MRLGAEAPGRRFGTIKKLEMALQQAPALPSWGFATFVEQKVQGAMNVRLRLWHSARTGAIVFGHAWSAPGRGVADWAPSSPSLSVGLTLFRGP